MSQEDGHGSAEMSTKDSEDVGLGLLDPETQHRFEQALPLPARINADSPGQLVLQMRQADQWLGLRGENDEPLLTTVWGFGLPGQTATYPGPTIVAHAGTPIQVDWQNKLPIAGHLLPVDTSIHLAGPRETTLNEGYIPTVIHRHEGHNESGSDGLPEAWYTQDYAERGPDFQQRLYTYDNEERAATQWYHDHTLGMTRLNVDAGLAGFYLLGDEIQDSLLRSGVLPAGEFNVEMAIQDRAFTSDGRLYYPAFPNDPIPGTDSTVADELPPDYAGPFPTVRPEFFGDFLLVNGMAWPRFEVEPGQYLFHLLNGSDSRFYVLRLDDTSVPVTLVGTDGGLLENALTVMDGDGVQEPHEQLVLAPGDRLDLVFDFSRVPGESVTLENIGPAFDPFKGLAADGSLAGDVGAATLEATVGQILRFDVADGSPLHNASVGDGVLLDPDYVQLREADADATRKLGLFEGEDEFGRVQPRLGVAEDTVDVEGNPVPFGPLDWFAPTTETPRLGSTEMWELYNFSEDAHPMHLHLVSYQVLGREKIDFTDEVENEHPAERESDGIPDDITGDGLITIGAEGRDDVVVGERIPLAPEDTGWQDTVWVGPGEVLRLAATFDLPGEYVWHCHILSHEDHQMMRPFDVIDPLG